MALFDSSMFGSGILPNWQAQASQPTQQPSLLDFLGSFLQGQGHSAQAQQSMPTTQQPQQPQMQPQPAASAIGDRLSSAFQGFVNSGSPMQAIGNLVGGLATGQRTDPAGVALEDANLTRQALTAQGLTPEMARIVAGNPTLLNSFLQQKLGVGGQTEDIKEYQFAKSQGFNGTLADWIQRKRAGAGEYGLNPVWGRDADGNPVMLQAGKSGEAIRTKLPDGVTLSGKEPIKMDAGTHFVLMDPLTRQVIGSIPKDLTGKAKAEEIGKIEGQSTVLIPQVETAVQNALNVINDLRNHPGLEIGTGLSAKIDPRSIVPGQPGYDFIEKNKTAQGQAFMAAREGLKGAGQVTDFEGTKGEQAITNLNTAQSKEQYLAALNTLEKMMVASLRNLQRKAGLTQPTAPANASPSATQTVPPQPIRVQTLEEARKLPRGTSIILPDGTPGWVP